MVYSDFSSLEDYISALLSKDPNKIKIYTEFYDGHCLRAFSYFAGEMPDIIAEHDKAKSNVERVAIVNSIKKRYPNMRQDSKAPTFLLTLKLASFTGNSTEKLL